MAVTALRGMDVAGITRSFLDFTTSMRSLKERKRIGEREERKLSMLEEQFGIEKKERAANEALRELQREATVLTTMPMAKLQARVLKERLSTLTRLMEGTEEEKALATDYLLEGAYTKSLRGQVDVLNQTVRQSQVESQTLRTQMQFTDMIRKGIDTEVEGIYSANIPAHLKILYGREVKGIMTARATGQFDPETMRPLPDVLADVRDAETEEIDRQLKADETKDKRKVEDTRVTTDLKYEITDKAAYDFGSLQEVETARVNLQPRPEVRQVWHDPAGWGILRGRKEKETGKIIPKEYQKAGYKWMTENRALELGLYDQWLLAGSEGKEQSIDEKIGGAIKEK